VADEYDGGRSGHHAPPPIQSLLNDGIDASFLAMGCAVIAVKASMVMFLDFSLEIA
jgi:hypothetical protein